MCRSQHQCEIEMYLHAIQLITYTHTVNVTDMLFEI